MSEIEFEELKRELKTLLSGYKKLTPEMIKKKRNYGICFCKKKKSFHFRLFSSRKKELDLKLLEQQAIVVPAKKSMRDFHQNNKKKKLLYRKKMLCRN